MRRSLLLLAIASVACTFEPPPATGDPDAAPGDAAPPILDAKPDDAEPSEDAADAGQEDGAPIDASDRDAEPTDAVETDGGPGCGNGLVEGAEACDDGNTFANDGCAACGIETGWTCAGIQPSVCQELCGDQMIVGGEQCDNDTAAADGDGCSSSCQIEVGWLCTGTPSSCTPDCGDSRVVGGELCDDGNNNPDDGCDPACVPELGWTCDSAEPSVCDPLCGDGLLRGGEACDDNNTQSTDGCAGDCTVENGFYCDGQPSECTIWWNPSYQRRRMIAVDRTGVNAELTDFPVLVRLTPQRIDYAMTAANGADLRFVADDQSTVIPHEIEEWNPSGASTIWVRFPRIRIDGSTLDPDRIWMYYDGPTGGNTVPSTQVWSASYEAVWHLDQTPAGAADEMLDSTANNHDGRTQGGMDAASSVRGQVGPALMFDGSNDLIDFGNIDPNNWTGISVEAWVYWTGSQDHVLSMASGTQPGEHIFSLEIPSGTSMRGRITTSGGGGGSSQAASPAGSLVLNQWHYLVMSWGTNDPRLRVFADGVELGSVARSGNEVQSSAERVVAGNINLADSRFVQGIIDEARLSRAPRDAEWYEAQHRSMIDTLLVYGGEQLVP